MPPSIYASNHDQLIISRPAVLSSCLRPRRVQQRKQRGQEAKGDQLGVEGGDGEGGDGSACGGKGGEGGARVGDW